MKAKVEVTNNTDKPATVKASADQKTVAPGTTLVDDKITERHQVAAQAASGAVGVLDAVVTNIGSEYMRVKVFAGGSDLSLAPSASGSLSGAGVEFKVERA